MKYLRLYSFVWLHQIKVIYSVSKQTKPFRDNYICLLHQYLGGWCFKFRPRLKNLIKTSTTEKKKKSIIFNMHFCCNYASHISNLKVSKVACSDPQPHPPPPTFFKHMEILVPKVESYLEGLMCEIWCADSM